MAVRTTPTSASSRAERVAAAPLTMGSGRVIPVRSSSVGGVISVRVFPEVGTEAGPCAVAGVGARTARPPGGGAPMIAASAVAPHPGFPGPAVVRRSGSLGYRRNRSGDDEQ